MRNFSTKGYNFTFKFNAKNALDVLTNPDHISPKAKYYPSSPTQTDEENDTTDNIDIDMETPKRTVIFKDTNPEHGEEKTNNDNDDLIEELLISNDENPTKNDQPTTDSATSLDSVNANDTCDDANDNDSSEDDTPKQSSLRYMQNLIHPRTGIITHQTLFLTLQSILLVNQVLILNITLNLKVKVIS